LLIDFSGFKKIIDAVGGIDIEVEKGFVDKEYPISGKENDFCGGDPKYACRYETVQFERGLQHMDGEKAFKYVRSRHAEGEEGTDFARDKRQQEVILAVKNKILSYPLWKEREKIKEIITVVDKMFQTDMSWSEKIILLKFLYETPTNKIRHLVLDSGDEMKGLKGFLVNPPAWKHDGLWVLEPRTGNFEEIQKYIVCQLENLDCPMRP
jgi:anionic cell wall polymer biosynthesis LytR-Cps2A-Psr (LCP) family protein